MRRALLLALATLAAGCSASPAAPCSPTLDACFTTADGWVLQAARAGDANDTNAPWALLVHGLNEDHHAYDKLAADLAARGWRVLAPDSRGHGASTTRTDGSARTLREFGSADFAAMEKDLDAAAKFLGAQPRLLVGASVGANEALRHAAAHRDLAGVVLLSPGLDYRGIATKDANAAHLGAAYFMASDEDAYAAQSARTLAASHPGPHEITIWSGKGHGTNLLDDETRRVIADWAARLGTASPPSG